MSPHRNTVETARLQIASTKAKPLTLNANLIHSSNNNNKAVITIMTVITVMVVYT